jgi:Transglycosylase SLT domain
LKWGLKRRNLIISKNTTIGALIVVITILILQLLTPQPAIPVTYTPRPPLLQVDAKAVAKELLTKEQYSCLNKLLSKESSWRPEAQNPKSSASGIGQMLSSTYKNLGMKKTDAGVSQLVATLAYISRRHVTPCNAWDHFKSKGWY